MHPPAPWTLSRADSPWRDYTSSYDEEQAGLRLAARPLTDAHQVPDPLAAFPRLLGIARWERRVHVESAFFSDLDRPDATRLAPGATAPIGTLKALPPGLTWADVARFLVWSQIIRTYVHVEAWLCPGPVQDDAAVYRLELRGEHTYFTYDRNTDPLAFAVRIDKVTGEMRIEGL